MTYYISSVRSMERHFQISSRMSGLLASLGDIGYLASCVFLAYFGGKGNRAKWVGGGCVLIAVACIVVSLPGYIFEAPSKSTNATEAFLSLQVHDDHSDSNSAQPETASDTPNLSYNISCLTAFEGTQLLTYASRSSGICNPPGNKMKRYLTKQSCIRKAGRSENKVALAIVSIGILLIGVGHSMPWSLGLPLIEDTVRKENSPLCFGKSLF